MDKGLRTKEGEEYDSSPWQVLAEELEALFEDSENIFGAPYPQPHSVFSFPASKKHNTTPEQDCQFLYSWPQHFDFRLFLAV